MSPPALWERNPKKPPGTRLLTVAEYLEERGLTAGATRQLAPRFGKRLKAAYVTGHGASPATSRRFVDGAQRNVAVYTEADRSLFDAVWRQLLDEGVI